MLINSKFINLNNIHHDHDSEDGKQRSHRKSVAVAPSESPAPPLDVKMISEQSAKRRSSMAFLPTKSRDLIDWLTFPRPSSNVAVVFNCMTLPFKWLLWTNKGLAGLTPDARLRERLCNQSTSLGSVAGLYLVVAISAFLTPPHHSTPEDAMLVHIYGVIMFAASMLLTVYLCIALTVMYPLLESIPDFAAVQAYRSLADTFGGYEQFFFNLGCQGVMIALLIAAKVLYNTEVVYWMIGIFFVLYCTAAFFTREFFVAIDPITSLHMGICNCAVTIRRAELLVSEISKQHNAFATDPDTADEWKAVNYLAAGSLSRNGSSSVDLNSTERPLHRSSRDLLSPVHSPRSSPRSHSSSPLLASRKRLPSNKVAAAEESSSSDKTWTEQKTAEAPTNVGSVVQFNEEPESRAEEQRDLREWSKKFDKRHQSRLVDVEEAEDEVEEVVVEAAAGRSAPPAGDVPSLQQIFAGERALILSRSGMSSAESQRVLDALRGQCCRDTQHLLAMVRWQLGCAPSQAVRAKFRDREGELNTRLLGILRDLNVPVFLVMDVGEFLKQYLN